MATPYRETKTSFTAGELAPELLGRPDLRAWANGARTLRNVFIQPTGGVRRRPGLRHIAILPGPARLISFEFNTEQTYLLVLTDGLLQVFVHDAELIRLAGPWTAAMLPQLTWTQSADTLLLCHPLLPPQRITRTGATSWTIQGWSFISPAYYRFAAPLVGIATSGATGSVTIDVEAATFTAGHVGSLIRVGGVPILITAVNTPLQAIGTVQGTLTTTGPTRDWQETAWSAAHGWPVSLCFHQDRLVIGGSRDLPNRLWMSQVGDLFNFDLGTGLDAQGIEFGLMSDQVNAIRAVFSGQHLQIFTSGGEWMVSGAPLTPSSVQLNRQTHVGSPVGSMVRPVDVDGATIFAARTGHGIYEFVYTLLQQYYQSNDLALAAHHLVNGPVDMAYDQVNRLLHVVMADGSLATLTLYRAEAVTAWTLQQTTGLFQAVADIEGPIWLVVERFGSTRLERFDPALALDAALTGTAAPARSDWSGLGHLEGQTVGVVADAAPAADAIVTSGQVILETPALSLQAGLPYTHVIEPLPPDLITPSGVLAAPLRLVSVTFRLLNTAALMVDLGRGPQPLPFRRLNTPLLDAPPPAFTGDVRLRGLGWTRNAMLPLWRIEDATPLPMTLLSVTTETRITT
jgi:hypothetical protein